jgi:hypothetical protein
VVTTPLALVVPEVGLTVPQPAPVSVQRTGSPATGVVPPETVTVAVKTWVVAPSAGTDFVAGVTVTTFGVVGGGLLV